MSDDWRSDEPTDEPGSGSSSEEPGGGFGAPPPPPPGWSQEEPTRRNQGESPGWGQEQGAGWQGGSQQGGYSQGSYAPQGYSDYGQYGYAAPKTNSMSVASLISGVLMFVCGVTWPLALVFGYMGRRQIDESQGRETGRGLAVAGIILGWIGAVLTVLGIIAFIAVIAAGVSGNRGFAP